jgi:hypothetical protein
MAMDVATVHRRTMADHSQCLTCSRVCWLWTWRWHLGRLGAVSIDSFSPIHTHQRQYRYDMTMSRHFTHELTNLRTHDNATDTYTIALPANLPPTFGGAALGFEYQFVVGACRAGAGPTPKLPGDAPSAGPGLSAIPPRRGAATASATSSSSRVMKVPIRVYNHVAGQSVSGFEDGIWPSTLDYDRY